jgi:hypothetical protein
MRGSLITNLFYYCTWKLNHGADPHGVNKQELKGDLKKEETSNRPCHLNCVGDFLNYNLKTSACTTPTPLR